MAPSKGFYLEWLREQFMQALSDLWSVSALHVPVCTSMYQLDLHTLNIPERLINPRLIFQ